MSQTRPGLVISGSSGAAAPARAFMEYVFLLGVGRLYIAQDKSTDDVSATKIAAIAAKR